jgi:hypothetical protein
MDAVTSIFENIGPDLTLEQVIQILLNAAIAFAAVVAVAFLIINGYRYMTAGGDAGKIEEAQKGLGNAIIGLIICISAALIVNFVLSLFGIDLADLNM